jgi:rhodanese-related sulfurtransferase
MRKIFGLTVVLMVVLTTTVFAANMLKPDVFKQWLESKKPMIIVDIQPAKDFEQHHFEGSVETNAYPVKTEEEKARLNKALEKAKASKDDIVIICPRGKGGAMNTYEYLKSKGIDEKRLYILEGGIAGWPYKEMFKKGR